MGRENQFLIWCFYKSAPASLPANCVVVLCAGNRKDPEEEAAAWNVVAPYPAIFRMYRWEESSKPSICQKPGKKEFDQVQLADAGKRVAKEREEVQLDQNPKDLFGSF